MLSCIMMDRKRVIESRKYFEKTYDRCVGSNKVNKQKNSCPIFKQLIELFDSFMSQFSKLLNTLIGALSSLKETSPKDSAQENVCIEIHATLEVMNIHDEQIKPKIVQTEADLIRNQLLPILDNSGQMYTVSIKTKRNKIEQS